MATFLSEERMRGEPERLRLLGLPCQRRCSLAGLAAGPASFLPPPVGAKLPSELGGRGWGRDKPVRAPPPSARSHLRSRVGPPGRGHWAGPSGPGQPAHSVGAAPPSPARLRSHRFLCRDLGSAAMSATDEVDGLGVSRPHYGCECGDLQRGGFGAGFSAS